MWIFGQPVSHTLCPRGSEAELRPANRCGSPWVLKGPVYQGNPSIFAKGHLWGGLLAQKGTGLATRSPSSALLPFFGGGFKAYDVDTFRFSLRLRLKFCQGVKPSAKDLSAAKAGRVGERGGEGAD